MPFTPVTRKSSNPGWTSIIKKDKINLHVWHWNYSYSVRINRASWNSNNSKNQLFCEKKFKNFTHHILGKIHFNFQHKHFFWSNLSYTINYGNWGNLYHVYKIVWTPLKSYPLKIFYKTSWTLQVCFEIMLMVVGSLFNF